MKDVSAATQQELQGSIQKVRRVRMFFRGCSSKLDIVNDESVQKLAIFRKLDLRMADGAAAAFGEILFNGLDVPVPFMCISEASGVTEVYKTLVGIWKLKEPSVILSVTGSTHLEKLDPRIEGAFVKGLALAASSAEAWAVNSALSCLKPLVM